MCFSRLPESWDKADGAERLPRRWPACFLYLDKCYRRISRRNAVIEEYLLYGPYASFIWTIVIEDCQEEKLDKCYRRISRRKTGQIL